MRWTVALPAGLAASVLLAVLGPGRARADASCPGGVTPVLAFQTASMSIQIGNAIELPPALTATCSGAPATGPRVMFTVANAGANAELPH